MPDEVHHSNGNTVESLRKSLKKKYILRGRGQGQFEKVVFFIYYLLLPLVEQIMYLFSIVASVLMKTLVSSGIAFFLTLPRSESKLGNDQ